MRGRSILTMAVLALVATACGRPAVQGVEDEGYRALVPSSIQLEQPAADGLPGGFAPLREAGIDIIEIVIAGDDLTVFIDGDEAFSRRVENRLTVGDSEGSGPFKGAKEVLVLGEEPLVLPGLTIEQPVVWPGSFDGSPVITVKTWDSDEGGPVVTCGADEWCLLLSSGVDPVGRYEDANNPALDENPIASIEVSETAIEFILDSGERVEMPREGESVTESCGLSETFVWDVPAEVGLTIDEAGVVQAACSTTPGDVLLHIFGRADMPVLAQLDPMFGGEWCRISGDCLMFVAAP